MRRKHVRQENTTKLKSNVTTLPFPSPQIERGVQKKQTYCCVDNKFWLPPTRPHTIITRAAIVFFQFFFYEAVVQHVTYVTDFCRVDRVVYPSWGTTPRNFQLSSAGVVAALQPVRYPGKTGRSLIFVWRFLVRLLLFHCMPAGRHSDSIPDSRRVHLCSRLPCGSYGAGSPTAVICSRELVSCGNGGTLCRSWVDTRGHVSVVCTLDHFTCAPSYREFLGGKA